MVDDHNLRQEVAGLSFNLCSDAHFMFYCTIYILSIKKFSNILCIKSYNIILMLSPLNSLEVHPLLDHVPEWRHVPQPLHLLHGPLHGVLHLLL